MPVVPLWAPFALLGAVCVVCPRPRWTRRVDWFVAGGWLAIIVYAVVFWFAFVRLAEWMVLP